MHYLVYLSILFILISCNRQKMETRKLIAKWQGREILFPQGFEAKFKGRDTLWTEWQEEKYKILNYIDSNGCTECQLQLANWQILKEEVLKEKLNVVFAFVIHAKDYEQLNHLQKTNRFDSPLLYDYEGLLNSLNHFPEEHFFRTFLLDENNKVILIGNPISKGRLWQLYKQRIRKGENK